MRTTWIRAALGALMLVPLSSFAISPGPESAPALKATMEVVGHGDATSAPEYARLTVNVSSICHETAAQARDASALLANQIVDVLNRFRRGPKDRVTASGNSSSVSTEYSGQQVLCSRKWRADNLLAIETSALDVLGELQSEVLRVIDLATPAGQQRQTTGSVSQFSFYLYPETISRLRLAAQKKALEDARSQFNGFAETCGFRNAVLKKISPPVVGVFAPQAAHAAPLPGGVQPPLLPAELKVDVQWKFLWEFDHGGTCLM